MYRGDNLTRLQIRIGKNHPIYIQNQEKKRMKGQKEPSGDNEKSKNNIAVEKKMSKNDNNTSNHQKKKNTNMPSKNENSPSSQDTVDRGSKSTKVAATQNTSSKKSNDQKGQKPHNKELDDYNNNYERFIKLGRDNKTHQTFKKPKKPTNLKNWFDENTKLDNAENRHEIFFHRNIQDADNRCLMYSMNNAFGFKVVDNQMMQLLAIAKSFSVIDQNASSNLSSDDSGLMNMLYNDMAGGVDNYSFETITDYIESRYPIGIGRARYENFSKRVFRMFNYRQITSFIFWQRIQKAKSSDDQPSEINHFMVFKKWAESWKKSDKYARKLWLILDNCLSRPYFLTDEFFVSKRDALPKKN